MKARHTQINLQFKFPAGTSRGVLLHKPSSFLVLEQDGLTGIGECSTIPDLSIDPMEFYEQKLNEVCKWINNGNDPENIDLSVFPSIAFGLETALLDLKANGSKKLFPSDFTEGKTGIPINGLVWMGDKEFMQKQITEKIAAGYQCIKLKVGALDFETGIQILRVLKDVNEKYKNTVIIITHNAAIAQMADKIIKMRSGYITEIIENKNPIEPERIEW